MKAIEALRTPDSRFQELPNFLDDPNYVNSLPGYEELRAHYLDWDLRTPNILSYAFMGLPEPFLIPEADHFVQEWGEPVVRAALNSSVMFNSPIR